MKHTVLLLSCFLCFANLSAQHIEHYPERLDDLLHKHRDMHYFQSPTLGRADSLFNSFYCRCYMVFDTDSICRQFIRNGGYNAMPDEIDFLYQEVLYNMSPERRLAEIEKIENIAKAHRSEDLMRMASFFRLMLIYFDNQPDLWAKKLEFLQQARQRNDMFWQLRVMQDIICHLYYSKRHVEVLEYIFDALDLLERATEEHYVGYRILYFIIGEIFYLYGFYDEAIPLLEKAVKPADYFFERTGLRALNALGLCYRKLNDLDASDAHFRAILESPDLVKHRGMYDAIAMCNLGKNYLLRRDLSQAEMLLEKGLMAMIDFDCIYDYPFISQMAISLGETYLRQGKPTQTKTMIELAHQYSQPHGTYETLKDKLFPLMSKYYAAIGDAKASIAYMDSAAMESKAYQEMYSPFRVFDIKKRLLDAEKQVKVEQLKQYRNLLISLVILFLLTGIFSVLYIKFRDRKNRALYKRIMEEERIQQQLTEQTQHLSELHSATGSNGKADLLYALTTLMTTEQPYTDPDLTRKVLAKRLNTNETYLINTIRDNYNGQNFSDYINTFRLKHAQKLLINNTELSIKEIAWEAGFSTYKYFYQLFCDKFGMSPSNFRKMSQSANYK